MGGCWGKALPCEGGGRSGLAQLPWGAVRSWGLCPCPDGIILEPMRHNSLEKSPTPGNKLLENLAACPSSEGLMGTRSSAVLSVRERTLRSLFVCLFTWNPAVFNACPCSGAPGSLPSPRFPFSRLWQGSEVVLGSWTRPGREMLKCTELLSSITHGRQFPPGGQSAPGTNCTNCCPCRAQGCHGVALMSLPSSGVVGFPFPLSGLFCCRAAQRNSQENKWKYSLNCGLEARIFQPAAALAVSFKDPWFPVPAAPCWAGCGGGCSTSLDIAWCWEMAFKIKSHILGIFITREIFGGFYNPSSPCLQFLYVVQKFCAQLWVNSS